MTPDEHYGRDMAQTGSGTGVTVGHYFAGTIGLSLIRHWYRDGAQNKARIAELRELLDRLDELPNSLVLDPLERDLPTGYAEWADFYDGPNPLIEAEEPAVRPIIEQFAAPGCRALDAACGTGRHAAFMAGLGCEVTGIDQSPEMLDVARTTTPAARFDEGDVESLPYADASFDLITISLALCHLADPTAAIVELGRVLAPGGHLVISDPHPRGGAIVGGQAFYGGIVPGERMRWVRNHYHGASTWLNAFRDAELEVVTCRELPFTEGQITATPAIAFYPDAVRSAVEGFVSLWVWAVRAR